MKLLRIATCVAILCAFCLWKVNARAQTTSVVLVGAGDIAYCDNEGFTESRATAALTDSISGKVFADGDFSYQTGVDSDILDCYDPTWGQFKSRTIPVPGDHEYISPNAFGYYNYWGPAAGDPSKGYYSLNYGAWHIIVLNSECSYIGGCTATSPEGQWLQSDLAAHPGVCTLALWHEPLFASTGWAVDTAVQPFWQILYNAHADIILNSHTHNYERFALQNPSGGLDTTNGIAEFVVGTGGSYMNTFTTTAANSLARNDTAFGVLELTLNSTSYSWQFVPVAGESYSDSGTQACHN